MLYGVVPCLHDSHDGEWLYSSNKKGNIGIPVAAVEGIGAGGSEGEAEDELVDEMTTSFRCTAV